MSGTEQGAGPAWSGRCGTSLEAAPGDDKGCEPWRSEEDHAQQRVPPFHNHDAAPYLFFQALRGGGTTGWFFFDRLMKGREITVGYILRSELNGIFHLPPRAALRYVADHQAHQRPSQLTTQTASLLEA